MHLNQVLFLWGYNSLATFKNLFYFLALTDLEPSQLLLFVQSFGIPVVSMSKLLHCLDQAVDTDSYEIEQAIVDKGYMAQLIEVQRMRGATGGDKFHRLLLEGSSNLIHQGSFCAIYYLFLTVYILYICFSFFSL